MGKPLPWRYLILALLAADLAHGEAGRLSAAPLVHVAQVASLTNPEAAQSLPVRIAATVTFVRPSEYTLFLMEDGQGIYARFHEDLGLEPGDLVEVTGVTQPSFKPSILAKSVRFLSHGTLPKPQPASFQDLIESKLDCQYVSISGRVVSASMEDTVDHSSLKFHIQVPQGAVEGELVDAGPLHPEDLLDAVIRMTGVAGGVYDGKMQLSGVTVNINRPRDIVILEPARANAWQSPLIPMDAVVAAYRYRNESQRVRIAGTLTYFEPGSLAVLDANGRSMTVRTDSVLPLHPGQSVEATGYPVLADESIGLEYGQLRATGTQIQALPKTVQWERASVGLYTYDLVAMEGEIVGVVHDDRVDLFLLQSEGHLFSATLRHRSSDAADGALNTARPSIGSRVRVTGVCFVDNGNHWRDRLWFDLRLRSWNDVVVLQPPSWWTVKRLAYMVTALSGLILVAVILVGLLDQRVRKQSAILARQSQEDAIRERHFARLEQQRSRILELISASAPLSEVLGEIQSMVSSRLLGAACWFELRSAPEKCGNGDGADAPGTVSRELFSPDGTSQGFLRTAPLPNYSGEGEISAALLVGARLAELAIDTQRLLSDLHRRSEYDLLTDIPNRFSMDKKLEELLLSAGRKEGVFGLIYVDLDEFKLVNDRYGHRIGDLYLQEATRRMKKQLRNRDMLARIGGDEFIALVPILRSRADAEEIAMRLERCFDEPFLLEGFTLHGSASVGLAVYPEDGDNPEDLQRSADCAMYAHKEGKRRQTLLPGQIERQIQNQVQSQIQDQIWHA